MPRSGPRVVVTGAAGLLGAHICRDLGSDHDVLPIDRRRLRGGHWRRVDVRRAGALSAAFAGADVVVDLASNPRVSASWSSVLDNNMRAAATCFEAAAEAGVRRVVYASTNHVTGGYEKDEPWASVLAGRYDGLDPRRLPRITPEHAARPDGAYAVGKAMAELTGRYAAERYGLSVVCLRIGHVSPTDRPQTPRDFAVYLSARDLQQLVRRAVDGPKIDYCVVYGVSMNTWRIWDLTNAHELLGYAPQDDAEQFRDERSPTEAATVAAG